MSFSQTPTKGGDSKDEEEKDPIESASTPKRRLLEAIKQDTSIDKEVRVMETQKIAKSISEKMWTSSLQSAIGNLSTSAASLTDAKDAK